MTPKSRPEYAMQSTFDTSHFRIYNMQTTREIAMKWLYDREANDDLARIDEELTAAGYTATEGGRALRNGILILWCGACLAGLWFLF